MTPNTAMKLSRNLLQAVTEEPTEKMIALAASLIMRAIEDEETPDTDAVIGAYGRGEETLIENHVRLERLCRRLETMLREREAA